MIDIDDPTEIALFVHKRRMFSGAIYHLINTLIAFTGWQFVNENLIYYLENED